MVFFLDNRLLKSDNKNHMNISQRKTIRLIRNVIHSCDQKVKKTTL